MPAKIAIQGELGSNSHMAAAAMLPEAGIAPCRTSAEVVDRVVSGAVDGAVLPFENSLHGSVAEHNDLLLRNPLCVLRESVLRIRHNVIAGPGVKLEEIRRVLSHPVALSQCRGWLGPHRVEAVPFYDTAGAVRHVLATGSRTEAAVAPELAARIYGGEVLVRGIEDSSENWTRFHLIAREDGSLWDGDDGQRRPDKLSLAFAIDHRPGTLVRSLNRLAEAGVNLSKIESRPVPGSPWEYVFHVDLRFGSEEQADRAVAMLRPETRMLKELGRYCAAAEGDAEGGESGVVVPETERSRGK